ncbi:hypothetical protein NMY22_g19135 [Coprinellus aureogranulatus]|nr:hypothetical protein NMY22_g19135 [Coprinellus aureogranulatus]
MRDEQAKGRTGIGWGALVDMEVRKKPTIPSPSTQPPPPKPPSRNQTRPPPSRRPKPDARRPTDTFPHSAHRNPITDHPRAIRPIISSARHRPSPFSFLPTCPALCACLFLVTVSQPLVLSESLGS